MNRITQLFSLGILLAFAANTPSLAVTLINEDFSDTSDWTDLSTAITWGNNTGATSAFTINEGAVQLTNDAFNYAGYTAPNSLKTFTALDQKFLEPIDHASSILTVDFRTRWNSVADSGAGENGRFIISLNYDYPAGGLNTTLDDKFDDFDQAWWARPAYHLRMRAGSSSNTQGTTLLQYGGGLTSAGEYESYDNSLTPQTPDWWLPGFISGAGGVSPGTAPDYPNNSWVSTSAGVATTSFSNYRYVIKPDAQEFWYDANNNGIFEGDELEAMMSLPITNEEAPLYQYFPTLEGIRLYWRGAGGESRGQVFLDNLIVNVESLTPSSAGQEAPALAEGNTDSSVAQSSGDWSSSTGQDALAAEGNNESTFISDLVQTAEVVDELTPIADTPPSVEPTLFPELLPTNKYLSASRATYAPLQAAKSVGKSASVPEPSQTFALIGLAGLGFLSRYQRKRV